MENQHTLTDVQLQATELYEKMESSGNCVVTGILDTKNPEIKTMFIAQLRDDVNSSDASKENTIFLGWGTGSRIIRATRSFKPSVFNAEVGTILPDNVNIQVEDQVGSPFYDGQEPRKRPNGGTTITKDNEPVYRNTSLVMGEPNHSIIRDYDRETSETTLPRVSFREETAASKGVETVV